MPSALKGIRVVSFDCGGVLLQPDGYAFVDVCQSIGIECLDGVIVQKAFAEAVLGVVHDCDPATYWASGRAARSLGIALGIGPEEGIRAWSAVQSLSECGRSLWTSLDASVPMALGALQAKGYKLAVLSNNSGLLRRQLSDAGIGAYFSAILDSHEIGVGKPERRAFGLVAERFGVRVDQCLHVGDDPYFDVAAAMRAGMSAVLYDKHELVEAQDGEVVIGDLFELVKELDLVIGGL